LAILLGVYDDLLADLGWHRFHAQLLAAGKTEDRYEQRHAR